MSQTKVINCKSIIVFIGDNGARVEYTCLTDAADTFFAGYQQSKAKITCEFIRGDLTISSSRKVKKTNESDLKYGRRCFDSQDVRSVFISEEFEIELI